MDGWEALYDSQEWYHKSCDIVTPYKAAVQRCCGCQQATPDHFSWNDLAVYVKSENMDDEEYFNFETTGRAVNMDEQIFTKETARIIVYWSPGSSEGYYVHVSRLTRENKVVDIALGKYWSPETAAETAKKLTTFIYNNY